MAGEALATDGRELGRAMPSDGRESDLRRVLYGMARYVRVLGEYRGSEGERERMRMRMREKGFRERKK